MWEAAGPLAWAELGSAPRAAAWALRGGSLGRDALCAPEPGLAFIGGRSGSSLSRSAPAIPAAGGDKGRLPEGLQGPKEAAGVGVGDGLVHKHLTPHCRTQAPIAGGPLTRGPRSSCPGKGAAGGCRRVEMRRGAKAARGRGALGAGAASWFPFPPAVSRNSSLAGFQVPGFSSVTRGWKEPRSARAGSQRAPPGTCSRAARPGQLSLSARRELHKEPRRDAAARPFARRARSRAER